MPFKEDITAVIVPRHLEGVIEKTFYAVMLQVCVVSKPVLCLRLEDNITDCAASFSLHLVSCSCGTAYVAVQLAACPNGPVIPPVYTLDQTKQLPVFNVNNLLSQTT